MFCCGVCSHEVVSRILGQIRFGCGHSLHSPLDTVRKQALHHTYGLPSPYLCESLSLAPGFASRVFFISGFLTQRIPSPALSPSISSQPNVVPCKIFMSNYKFSACWGAASSGSAWSPAPSQQVCLGCRHLTWRPSGQVSSSGKLFIDVPSRGKHSSMHVFISHPR